MKSSLIPKWFIAANNHGDHGNTCRNLVNDRLNQTFRRFKRFKKKAYEEWQKDYRQHSLDIGRSIHRIWMNPCRLATCQYYGGRFEFHPPMEPAGENSGLARLHLINGYPVEWDLYQKARAESTDICTKISKIVESFEKQIITAVDAKSPVYDLQRRDSGYSPKKCDDLHYYIDNHVFDAVFELVQDGLDGKELRTMTIEPMNYTIGGVLYPCSSLRLLNGLGAGNHQEIIELKKRIENLIANPTIRSLVEQYNELIKQLHNSQLKKLYYDGISDIWTGIHDDGNMLKAEDVCKNINECRPRPPTPDG